MTTAAPDVTQNGQDVTPSALSSTESVGPTQAARALGVKRETVSRWLRDGKVEGVTDDHGNRRMPRDEFDRLLTERRGKPDRDRQLVLAQQAISTYEEGHRALVAALERLDAITGWHPLKRRRAEAELHGAIRALTRADLEPGVAPPG